MEQLRPPVQCILLVSPNYPIPAELCWEFSLLKSVSLPQQPMKQGLVLGSVLFWAKALGFLSWVVKVFANT